METLKLSLDTAKKLYPDVPDFFKKILEDTFGTKELSINILERIKTFEDAMECLPKKQKDFYDSFDWSLLPDDETAYRKLKIIVKVINQNWEPDWNDSSQKKWYPWFNMSSPSGFGFSNSCSDYSLTTTSVGSRLCFESQEKSDYVANQFIDLYKQFLTI